MMFAAGSSPKRYRVVQWGTGGVGKHALRAIAERRDLDLVGVRVYDPRKVGLDAGEIYGGPATGIACVGSLEEVLALDADCVNYNALSSSSPNPLVVFDDICALLEAGFNVTSSAPELLIYPAFNPRELLDRIDDACRRGNSSLFVSGINPGFMFDVLPIILSRVCRRIDKLYCLETTSMRHMKSEGHMQAIGFGLPMSAPDFFYEYISGNLAYNGYATVIHLLAEALQVDIERVEMRSERAVSDRPIEIAITTLPADTVTVRRFGFVGWSKGREVIELDFCWRMDPDVRPDWPSGEGYEVRFEGDPAMQVAITAQTEFDTKRPISLYVAMSTVNAIPAICDATPGLKNVLDLPLFGGRMLTSNA